MMEAVPLEEMDSLSTNFETKVLGRMPSSNSHSQHIQGDVITEPLFVRTSIPARLDRLPFSGFHYFVVFALGITWMLDGLEVTLVGVVSGLLTRPETLNLSELQIGMTATIYLGGAITGSLIFGYLCDRYGRKKLYLIVPCVYLVGTALTAFSWDFYSFSVLRFITGAGLGGEYAAMNSAIDELIPCRVRGTVDLIVNGSYWLGTILASIVSLAVLNPNVISNANVAWRLMFIIGAVLGILIIILRIFLPESPRWLLTHGKQEQAEEIVNDIEARVCRWKKISVADLPSPHRTIIIELHKKIGFLDIAKTMLFVYPKRTILGLTLMICQAFFFNGIFFSYTLILIEYYGVASDKVGVYLLPFAIGNFLGPLSIGRLFDIIGRRIMICSTYSLSGVILIISGILFSLHYLNAITQTLMWAIIAFFASAAASSAYLTVSEIFPIEIRGLAISLFYSVGTAIGGFVAPSIFGLLLQSHKEINIMYGYLFGAFCMIFAAVVEFAFGLSTEQKSLEDITPPMSSVEAEKIEMETL